MRNLQALTKQRLVYNHIVGTGGIGSGMFFSMEGDHTLGRNESRMAALEPFKDYCKQHIIMHYVAVLMGAGSDGGFHSLPIGMVGGDEPGNRLIHQMRAVGMDTSFVKISSEYATLFSVCFQYSDSSGGNITTAGSASSLLRPKDISEFFKAYHLDGKKGVVLSVPEVPVDTRIELLKYGRKHGCLNVGAVASAEMEEFSRLNGFGMCDILAINMDEAQSISGLKGDVQDPKQVVDACVEKLISQYPNITLLITNGGVGSYAIRKGECEFTHSLKADVVSTAGAGDAFIGGVISGLCCGLPLFRGDSTSGYGDEALKTAVDLGTLLASFSVSSADTIHADASAETLYQYLHKHMLETTDQFGGLFSGLAGA